MKLCLVRLKHLAHLSRPPWARGLKLQVHEAVALAVEVAPPVGAWIETCLTLQKVC